jgi:signal transduction histidine kinase
MRGTRFDHREGKGSLTNEMNEETGSAALRAARNEERRALADRLHAGLAQTLTAARAYLDVYQLTRPKEDGAGEPQQLARAIELLEASAVDLRRIIRELREEIPE